MRRLHVLFAGTLILPVAVETPPPGGGHATSVSAAAGAGSLAFVTRGCEGRVLTADKLKLRDAGAAVVHRFPGPVSIGVRGGVTEIGDGLTNNYINPHASLDWDYIGFGGGYVHSTDFLYTGGEDFAPRRTQFASAHLRFGQPDRVCLILSLAEGVPIYTDGGLFEIGMGVKPHQRVQAMLGLSMLPYDGAGVGLHTRIETLPELYLDLSGRVGGSAGIEENAIKVGITYRAVYDALR
jgi:hypothetical protein